MVNASAGTGKSTLLEAVAPPGSVILCYGRAPADEMAERIAGTNRFATTFHSYGKTLIEDHFQGSWFNEGRMHWIILEIAFKGVKPDGEQWGQYFAIRKAITWLKNMAAHPDDPQKVIDEYIDDERFEIDDEHILPVKEHALPLLQRMAQLDKSKKGREYCGYDIDDMRWLCYIHGLTQNVNDLFVDELQDINPLQLALLKLWGKRLYGVGDERQSIFGFQGAMLDSMERFQKQFKAKRFPLTVCWRCPSSHIEWAQQINPDITCRPGAPVGEINEMPEIDLDSIQSDGALVICRNNAPLVRQFYRARNEQSKPVYMMGKAFITGLCELVGGKWEAKKAIDSKWLDKFEERIEKRIERARTSLSKSAISDNSDAIRNIINAVKPETVGDLHETIVADFTPPKDMESNSIRMSTIHSAKGLEHRHVIWYGPELCPNANATETWAMTQEQWLIYIARTRAKYRVDCVPAESVDESKKSDAESDE